LELAYSLLLYNKFASKLFYGEMQMAHITEFTVSGLAGRNGAYHQVLDRYVNIFFGLNGSGKTSLLKILDSAMSLNGKILENVPFTNAEVKVFSNDYNKIFTYTASKKDITKIRKSENQVTIEGLFETTLEEENSKQTSTIKWEETP
jgi:AAA15 family ATPase/GTPase